MAARPARVNDIIAGLSVGAYLIAVPMMAPTLWNRSFGSRESLVHYCIGALLGLWAFVGCNLAVTCLRIRRGQRERGGFAWLAGALLSIGSFLVPSLASAATTHDHAPSSQHVGVGAAVGLPLALVAKKRRDELLQVRAYLADESVDSAIEELRERNDGFLYALRRAIGTQESGRVRLDNDASADPDVFTSPVVAIPVRRDGSTWTISFAGLGSRLSLPDDLTRRDLEAGLVALHPRGRVVIGDDLVSTLRHLVLRDHDGVVVVHASEEVLDPEIASQCVVAPLRTSTRASVMVRLLQPEATVEGLERPFDSDLRRKCIEMLSYLTVHPETGISGDRLRARVLGSREQDASTRTLNNTASAIRRSLGENGGTPRLAPVGSSGLYRAHDVMCDVTIFYDLVERARHSDPDAQRDLLLEAIALVRGEPLAAEPRGYEWFLAEGHYARVLRTLEFAVVTLLESAPYDTDVQWRARDAMGRFDPVHALSGDHVRPDRFPQP